MPGAPRRRPPESADLLRLAAELARHKVEYAILGGAAMALHGFPRMTKDIDLIVPRSPRNNARLLKALEEGARRYEEAGLYLSARKLHHRAIELGRSAEDELRIVPALRGMARAYRLEYTYGLALPDIVDPESRASGLRSLETEKYRFDRRGQESLERAVAILRKYPQHRAELIKTLVELGDWHQLAGHHRVALEIYREAWQALHAPDAPEAADLRDGSWWPAWVEWLDGHSTRDPVRPPTMAAPKKGLAALADAPGTYVHQR